MNRALAVDRIRRLREDQRLWQHIHDEAVAAELQATYQADTARGTQQQAKAKIEDDQRQIDRLLDELGRAQQEAG